MTLNIRTSDLSDLDVLSALLLSDAKERQVVDPILWKLGPAPLEKIITTLKVAMEAENPPFRQKWLLAEVDGKAVGVAHSILLPVPPIYAGEFGPPGLIMEDCFVSADAPPQTKNALLHAAEIDLMESGAQILLASSIEGGTWESEYAVGGYEPLTMYFAKTGLSKASVATSVRKATEEDVPAIIASSARNRQILNDLPSVFWKPHEDADARFGAWMKRSLTLTDRDMFVSEVDGIIQGYAISHPATPLHFPTPHDISGVGVIDDYYHEELKSPTALGSRADQAAALFRAAESAREKRGDHSVLVVCPATWKAKIDLLTGAGYNNAITWFFKKIG